MEEKRAEETHTPSSPDHVTPTSKPVVKYRVRTGCLVCRARKVKCDEQRPSCRKCVRLKKSCSYSIPSGRPIARVSPPATDSDDAQQCHSYSQRLPGGFREESEVGDYWSPGNASLPEMVPSLSRTELPDHSNDRVPAQPSTLSNGNSSGQPFSHHDDSSSRAAPLPDAAGSPATDRYHATSQIIYLTTVMDWQAVAEGPVLASFSYFIEVVDCPLLEPFDHLNWTKIKRYIADLGRQHEAVAKSVLAVQALYRAQVDHLAMSHATTTYQAALDDFPPFAANNAVDFDLVLVVAFLLCLGAVTLPNDDSPHLEALCGIFVVKLQTWILGQYHSSVSLRICAWLQLLNTTSKRPGSPGLLSPSVLTLLYDHIKEVPILSCPDRATQPEHHLYETIATPVFNFHLQVQRISNQVADVTHYRRSRTSPTDQAEVTEILTSLEEDLSNLWSSRPAPLQLDPPTIRQHLSAQIAKSIIALSGICIAAFHAEIISIGRILGDPPFPSEEAKQAKNQLRSIVEGDWNVVVGDGGDALNPGYMRPLFVYGLESFQGDESDWAATQLRRIKHCISSGDFLAAFLEAHGEAQRSQSRRVTMKYFCYQNFRVPLPFM